MKRYTPVAFFLLVSTLVSAAQERSSADASTFVLDPSRPYVYLLFDHSATGVRSSEADSKTRLWFWLVNNCRIPISVRTSGIPKGRQVGEVGLNYEVVKNRAIREITSTPSMAETGEAQHLQTTGPSDIPEGTISEVGSTDVIPPKGSLLFSIPANHLSDKWHIEIPYEFATAQKRSPRNEGVGGQPMMVLLYRETDLPNHVRRAPDMKR